MSENDTKKERFCRRVHTLTPLALALFAFSLPVCSAAESDFQAPPSRALGSGYPTFTAPAGAGTEAAEPSYEEPLGVLTLPRALALALLENPELAAFSWEIRVQEAEALQAGLLPNPELIVDAENFAGSGVYQGYNAAETTVTLGQLVELGGKRSKRRRLAELERDLSDWDYEVRRLDVLTSVTQAFVGVVEAQQRLALADELVEIASAFLGAVSKQVRAGATSSVERTRAKVSVSSAKVGRRRAEAALEAARSRLAAEWGARSPTFESASGDLRLVADPPPLELLQGRLENNPDVARWVTELEQRNALVSLEDSRKIPNVTAAIGARRLEQASDTAVVFGLTVPLPIFDRNQGARQAARYGRAKARSQQRAATVRAAAALAVTYQEFRASFAEVEALRSQVLPQAKKAFDGVNTGYLRGLFRYVDVLEAQRTLFELRDRELVALGSYHRAAAEVERLTGEPI